MTNSRVVSALCCAILTIALFHSHGGIAQEAEQFSLPNYFQTHKCGDLLSPDDTAEFESLKIKTATIPVVKFRIRPSRHDYFKNSLYLHSDDYERVKNHRRYLEVNQAFLQDLPLDKLNDQALKHTRFMTTARDGDEEFVTLYQIMDGRFAGFVFRLDKGVVNFCHVPAGSSQNMEIRNIFTEWIKPVEGNGRLYIIGDDLRSLDFPSISTTFKTAIVRRSTQISRDLLETEKRLDEISHRGLRPENTILLNGLPKSRQELVNAGYQANQQTPIRQLSERVQAFMSEFYAGGKNRELEMRIEQLLLDDENDLVIIIAHSDKKTIYLNGQQISIDELQRYPDRIKRSSRGRVCLLLSCNTGNFNNQVGTIFKRSLESLSEVFIRKGYFDLVIAPRGSIDTTQTYDILKNYLSGIAVNEIRLRYYNDIFDIAKDLSTDKVRNEQTR
jgi:hypothetical protein